MATLLGNERLTFLSGRYRTACTLAAVVVMSVFAADAVFPSAASPAAPTALHNEPKPAEIKVVAAPPKVKVFKRIKSGLASWYGEVWQGRLTASGKRFDMNELTAAHRTLPFGSKVKVTDLHNHRSVVVTITDRGDFPEDRVIDLSLGAAKELRMVGVGLAPVRLELIAQN